MKSGVLSIMIPAFAECLVLVGIHSYLGLHVIKRKVIFVDLALAQIAALGATVGFLFGMDPTSNAAFIFSMVFTFVGAAIFALTRLRSERIPQEAVIGLVYALAAAIAILVIDKSPHGAEHIKDLLTGTILWVQWPEIIGAAVAYSFVGLFHYLLRHRFILITEDPSGAYQSGVWVRFWDFLFYLSFGFVISFSVQTAGVLLVFVFLVAPAIMAVLLTDRWLYQLIVGWGMGTLVTVLALFVSYVLDLPSGPTVVAFYGVVLLLVSLAAFWFKSKDRKAAGARLGIGIAGIAVVVAGLWALGTLLGSSSMAVDHAHHRTSEMRSHLEESPEPDGLKKEQDPIARLQVLKERVEENAPGWKKALVETVCDSDLPLLFRDKALRMLEDKAKTKFGYSFASPDNTEAVTKMRQWTGE
ncbi:MAG: iron chelate uptake ABC transporter family permease subunit [Pseudomonadota bacterium]